MSSPQNTIDLNSQITELLRDILLGNEEISRLENTIIKPVRWYENSVSSTKTSTMISFLQHEVHKYRLNEIELRNELKKEIILRRDAIDEYSGFFKLHSVQEPKVIA
jgi:hypothetical protein